MYIYIYILFYLYTYDAYLLLLPLALQPTVGFGLSNNVLPFFPICHQLSPSSHSQHLNISFYFLFPSFPWVFPFFSSLPVLEWRTFWHLWCICNCFIIIVYCTSMQFLVLWIAILERALTVIHYYMTAFFQCWFYDTSFPVLSPSSDILQHDYFIQQHWHMKHMLFFHTFPLNYDIIDPMP